MIRFGILSTARIARALFRHPLDTVQITAVASRDKAKAEAFANEFGIPKAMEGYDRLLADPDIDAVYIALPQHLHAEYVIKAANAGKHILLEKPAALNSAELRKMIATCKKRNVLMMEAFMYRFLRVHNRAKEIVQEGTIGELRYIDFNLSFNAWARGLDGFRLNKATGGGALYDLGIYGADFLRFILGKTPRLVKAHMRKDKKTGIDVFTHAIYATGPTVASMTIGFNTDANSYLLSGERGSIYNTVALSGRHEPQLLSIHLHKDNSRTEEHFPADTPYKWEIEYFARCIERNEQPFLSPENSLEDMKMIDQLFQKSTLF
ncbi:MAG: Gfo/Idh/MocA family protein [Bacteroidota bacterium]